MKQFLMLFFTVFLLLVVLQVDTNGQTVTATKADLNVNYEAITFTATVDNDSTFYSSEFNFNGCGPISTIFRDYSQANDSIYWSVVRQVRANTGKWKDYETIFTDSTNAVFYKHDTLAVYPIAQRYKITSGAKNGVTSTLNMVEIIKKE